MIRLVRLVGVVLFVSAMSSCGGGGDGGQLLQLTPATGGTTLTSSISSAQTGIAYTYDVWLPPGYAEGTASYPVVYATDCEYRWAPLLQDVQQFAAHGGTPVIQNLYALISSRNYLGLRSIQPNYSPQSHVGMDGPAFYDALSFIFGSP